jgi:hypothetical protein
VPRPPPAARSWADRPALRLQNKPPHWNEGLRCWCLNFRGRVKLASVKNFQLMCSNDVTGRIMLQFGKVRARWACRLQACLSAGGSSKRPPQPHTRRRGEGRRLRRQWQSPAAAAAAASLRPWCLGRCIGPSACQQLWRLQGAQASRTLSLLLPLLLLQVERNAFVLDFNPCVISAAQAFAIALTSFETKLLL